MKAQQSAHAHPRKHTARPGADVGRPVPAQMWAGTSRRRCGPASPGADVGRGYDLRCLHQRHEIRAGMAAAHPNADMSAASRRSPRLLNDDRNDGTENQNNGTENRNDGSDNRNRGHRLNSAAISASSSPRWRTRSVGEANRASVASAGARSTCGNEACMHAAVGARSTRQGRVARKHTLLLTRGAGAAIGAALNAFSAGTCAYSTV
jgi:hypothetical protein